MTFDKARAERWRRWFVCSLCEQMYHGVVACALGWACWKMYLGRPEGNEVRLLAMNQLGNGLSDAGRHEDALSVRDAELSMLRRIGAPATNILIAQGNLASTYRRLGQLERALQMQRDAYSGWVKLNGEENEETLRAVLNYADSLTSLERFEEAKTLLLKSMPVARQVLGENHEDTLKMRWIYAMALYRDAGATLDDLRKAATTLEETERIARRVLGGAHPVTTGIETILHNAQAKLRAREASPGTG